MDMILGIFGAGSLGKELCDIARRIQQREGRWETIVFVDEVTEQKEFYGAPVHRPQDYHGRWEEIEFVIANGTPRSRHQIFDRLVAAGAQVTNLVDPTAIVSPTAKLGKGIIVTPYSTISSDVVLADDVLVQSYVRVGHDIQVGAHSVLSSNVGIGGGTNIGEDTYIALGAMVRDGLVVGSNTVVGMGAMVSRDIPDGVIALGNPARVMRRNETGKIFDHKG